MPGLSGDPEVEVRAIYEKMGRGQKHRKIAIVMLDGRRPAVAMFTTVRSLEEGKREIHKWP